MTTKKLFFNFGEEIKEYDFKVINEREARASAGLMFLFGMVSLFSVFTLRTLLWVELFTITFIVEFFVRLLFNPKYAPYMMLASFIVQNQEAEWVEARPKKFAWGLGGILAIVMSYYLIFDIISVLRFALCFVCLTLLFLESSFGICLGCIVYKFLEIKLLKCPGGVCKIKKAKAYEKRKIFFLIFFFTLFLATYLYLHHVETLESIHTVIV